ncbi:helix-turn-helix domain-containing protein [Paenibacillus rigui]|nr:helix-turn-helix transcriptional regulator [Paenibacillus rigui]
MSIRVLRTLHGLTQKQIADKLGTHQPVYAMFENGAVRPSAEHHEQLVKILRANEAHSISVIEAIRAWKDEANV